MKKSSLLSLATAGAIVATSVGTFAVWDVTTGTSKGTITVANPSVTMTAEDMTMKEGTDTVGADSIDYTGTANFNVVNEGNKVDTMTLTPKITATDATTINAEDVTVSIKKGETTLTGTGPFVDSSVNSGANNYAVTVTVKNKDLAGKTLNVELKGDLSKAGA